MKTFIKKGTYATFGEAVLEVEDWAKNQSLPAGKLFAMIDARDPDAVVATLASRDHWALAITMLGGDEGDPIRKALRTTAGSDVVHVWTCSAEEHVTATVGELAERVRDNRAQARQEANNGG